MRFLYIILYFILPIGCVDANIGKDSGLQIPRFVTLKSNIVNMRTGPGNKYPIQWEYRRKFYPLEVIAEFGAWRKVRDIDNAQGWIHTALLFSRKYAVIIDNNSNNKAYNINLKEMVLLRHPLDDAYPILRVGLGNIVGINECNIDWCQVCISKYNGWIRKENLWGIYKNDIVE